MPPPDGTSSTTTQPSTALAGSSVRVRMYRQGLGDCFLVTFDPGGNEVHMLIDCGTLGATTTHVSLRDVVADIRQTTNDHLHLLIATHEHQDHVGGFRSLKGEFQKIRVDHVWLAWTENPKDKFAQKIAKYKNDLGIALAHAAQALAKTTDDAEATKLGLAIRDLLSFAGDPEALGADGLAKTIDEAMDFVRTGLVAKPRYLKPGGAVIEQSWLPGFRFYVLGPPRSEAKLNDLGETGSGELYHLTAGLNAGASMRTSRGTSKDPLVEREKPFDSRFESFDQHPLTAQVLANYRDPDQHWRRIDSDWLQAASDLALQLDSLTNNTSLALAIERISDGKVLLFPADAQQGNWLSWHDAAMKWSVPDTSGDTQEVTAADLLKRTVFYKVGHHSSHNATAKGHGLELMASNELVAFIPVDRAVAQQRHPKKSWKMPARALYRRLLQKCQGRVARSDLGWADDAAYAANKKVEEEFKAMANASTWATWKQGQQTAPVQIKEQFIDYVLS